MSTSTVSGQWTRGVLRRSLPRLLAAVLVGALIGVAIASLRPPRYTSTTLVLLPDSRAADPTAVDSGNATSDVATQVQIVLSTTVLGSVAQQLSPPQTYRQLRSRVSAKASTDRLLEISAKDATPAGAVAVVTLVTDTYRKYVEQNVQVAASTVLADLRNREKALTQQIAALDAEIKATVARQQAVAPGSAAASREAELLAQLQIERANVTIQLDKVRDRIATTVTPDSNSGVGLALAQPASPAQAMSLTSWRLLWGLLGAVLAGLIAIVVLLGVARRDRRLRLRDQIADAVGSPVVAAVDARPQGSARGWFGLMKTYRPPPAQAWALRQVLRLTGEGPLPRGPRRLILITLANDERALALGPQLASFASITGVNTRYFVGAGREHAATLWQTMSGAQPVTPRRGLTLGDLDLGSSLGADSADTASGLDQIDLVIVHEVVDRLAPHLPFIGAEPSVLLAVSTGFATNVELARVALAVDAASASIAGVLVADPDPADQTSGRRTYETPSRPVALPNRLTGLAAPTERRSG